MHHIRSDDGAKHEVPDEIHDEARAILERLDTMRDRKVKLATRIDVLAIALDEAHHNKYG